MKRTQDIIAKVDKKREGPKGIRLKGALKKKIAKTAKITGIAEHAIMIIALEYFFDAKNN